MQGRHFTKRTLTSTFELDGVPRWGCNAHGQLSLPALEEGVTYTQADVSAHHTVLLRSDGKAVACGENRNGQCTFPEPGEGVIYTQVAAGDFHTTLLRSDGVAISCGNDQCIGYRPTRIVPPRWRDIRAFHFSDGTPRCLPPPRQSDIPPLAEGVKYTQVSANDSTTVLLRSDGTAVACGCNHFGQCDLPVEEGVRYTQVASGGSHTVLLRSDGTVVAVGRDNVGEVSRIPVLEGGRTYIQVLPSSWLGSGHGWPTANVLYHPPRLATWSCPQCALWPTAARCLGPIASLSTSAAAVDTDTSPIGLHFLWVGSRSW